MANESPPAGSKIYTAGDLGAGARLAMGEHITWTEGVSGLPDGPALKAAFDSLLGRIGKDKELDEVTQALATSKVSAVADGLATAKTSPGKLHLALVDAANFFKSTASWVGRGLADVLKSEPAQKTLGTVTEAATKAAIESFVG